MLSREERSQVKNIMQKLLLLLNSRSWGNATLRSIRIRLSVSRCPHARKKKDTDIIQLSGWMDPPYLTLILILVYGGTSIMISSARTDKLFRNRTLVFFRSVMIPVRRENYIFGTNVHFLKMKTRLNEKGSSHRRILMLQTRSRSGSMADRVALHSVGCSQKTARK